MEDRTEYLKRTKRVLHKRGFLCMILSMFLLLFMFLFYMDGQGTVINFPVKIFWYFQKFFTVTFVIGAVSYLVSLTIKLEEEEDDK